MFYQILIVIYFCYEYMQTVMFIFNSKLTMPFYWKFTNSLIWTELTNVSEPIN